MLYFCQSIRTELSDVILEIHCPHSVYQALWAQGKDKQTLGREARESLALRLYGEHRLSLGKAAELAALPIVKFMGSACRRCRCPWSSMAKMNMHKISEPLRI